MKKEKKPTIDSMETIILKQIVSQIDLSEYLPQIKEAVKGYFDSNGFKNDLEEAFQEYEIAGDFVQLLIPKLRKVIEKNMKITFGNK